MSPLEGHTGEPMMPPAFDSFPQSPEGMGPFLSGLLSLLNSLLSKPDTQTLIDQVILSLKQVMSCEASYFFFVGKDGSLINSHYQGVELGTRWESMKIGSDASFAAAVAQAGKPISTSDITQESYYNPELHGDRMCAFCGAPVTVNGRLYGIIEVMWGKKRVVSTMEREVVALAAERITESFSAIENLKSERRQAELSAALAELTLQMNDPEIISDETPEGAYSYFEIVGRALDAKIVLLYTGGQHDDEYGSPLWVVYEGKELDLRAPFDIFRRYVDAGDNALRDVLTDETAIADWAVEHFGITQGKIISNQPVKNSTGGMIIGRTADKEDFTSSEIQFLREATEVITNAQRSIALRLDEGEISRTLQSALVSRVSETDGFSFDSIYKSATSHSLVGGDFFEVIELPENRMAVLLGDISGKGINVASLSYLIKNLVSAVLLKRSDNPQEAIQVLNAVMVSAPNIRNFASMILIVIDRETGHANYCCAGHPPACLKRKNGDSELLEDRSPLVGALEDVEFKKVDLDLNHGDVLFFYTDGATEARSPEHEFFGEERVVELFKKQIENGFENVTDRMLESIEEFAGGSLNDDLAMLAVRYN